MKDSSSCRFLVVTHVPHVYFEGKCYAYGPYVREMNLWLNYVDEFVLVAPVVEGKGLDPIDLPYSMNPTRHRRVDSLYFGTMSNAIRSLSSAVRIMGVLLDEMKSASHIHLRCPGNMGLLGCLAQIVFPKTKKTAKYAGNWDNRSREPFSYRLQQKILRSEALTSNMTALVYGDWPGRTKNIKPFFTASYTDSEKVVVKKKAIGERIRLTFVGVLEDYKSPEKVVAVAHRLKELGVDFSLEFCGNGSLRSSLEQEVDALGLSNEVRFLGNVPASEIKERFQKAHFLVFVSKSEGWPKAVAEAMFWGCVPITTDVSCVGDMVGRNGERGVLVDADPEQISEVIVKISKNPLLYQSMSESAMDWSRNYTLEYFESEIKKLI